MSSDIDAYFFMDILSFLHMLQPHMGLQTKAIGCRSKLGVSVAAEQSLYADEWTENAL